MRWRQRIGEAGCEWLLTQTIGAAQGSGTIKQRSLTTVVLDTTIQAKAIAHPTDSRLLNKAREQLVAAAQEENLPLRQSYARVGDAAQHRAGRYAHARQFKRMRREVKELRTWLGRVIRDVERKVETPAKPYASAWTWPSGYRTSPMSRLARAGCTWPSSSTSWSGASSAGG